MALRALRNGRTEDQDDQAEDRRGVETPPFRSPFPQETERVLFPSSRLL